MTRTRCCNSAERRGSGGAWRPRTISDHYATFPVVRITIGSNSCIVVAGSNAVLGPESVPHRNPPGDGRRLHALVSFCLRLSPFVSFCLLLENFRIRRRSAVIRRKSWKRMTDRGKYPHFAGRPSIIGQCQCQSTLETVPRTLQHGTSLPTNVCSYSEGMSISPDGRLARILQRFLIPRNVEIDSLYSPTIASRAWGSLLDQFDHPRR